MMKLCFALLAVTLLLRGLLTKDPSQVEARAVRFLIFGVYHNTISSFHGIETCAPLLDTVLAEANVLLVTAAQMSNSTF
jgi:hypothetical protein